MGAPAASASLLGSRAYCLCCRASDAHEVTICAAVRSKTAECLFVVSEQEGAYGCAREGAVGELRLMLDSAISVLL